MKTASCSPQPSWITRCRKVPRYRASYRCWSRFPPRSAHSARRVWASRRLCRWARPSPTPFSMLSVSAYPTCPSRLSVCSKPCIKDSNMKMLGQMRRIWPNIFILLTKILRHCCQYLRALFHLRQIGPLDDRVFSFAAGAENDGRDTGTREQCRIHPACAADLRDLAPQSLPRLLQYCLRHRLLQRDFKRLARQSGCHAGLKGRVVRGNAREDGGQLGFDTLHGFAGDGAPFYAEGAAFGIARKLLPAFDQGCMDGTSAEQSMGRC